MFSCVQLFSIAWTVAHQAPLSMEYSGKNTGADCHLLLQGSSWTRVWIHVSCVCCIGRQILYYYTTWAINSSPCFSFGEVNGNPLHYSCLENPLDGGGWWAAVYWVAQSRTRLKHLSSSSSSSSSCFSFCSSKNLVVIHYPRDHFQILQNWSPLWSYLGASLIYLKW